MHLQVSLRESRFLAEVSQSSARMPMKEDTQQYLSLSLALCVGVVSIEASSLITLLLKGSFFCWLALSSDPWLRVSLAFLAKKSQKQKVRKIRHCEHKFVKRIYTVVKHKTTRKCTETPHTGGHPQCFDSLWWDVVIPMYRHEEWWYNSIIVIVPWQPFYRK